MRCVERMVLVCALSFGLAGLTRAQSAGGSPSGGGFLQDLPPLAESLTGRAKEQYDGAHVLLLDEDYAGAVVKFRQAYDLSGDPRLLWNLTGCEKSLRHYATALDLLERYRDETVGRLTERHRAEVAELVQTLELRVSYVQFEVDEADADVFVDGVLRGRTPLPRALRLDLGQHSLRIAKEGFADALFNQELAGGSTLSLHVDLRPLPPPEPAPAQQPLAAPVARLSITTGPDASIWIDGRRVARQAWSGELPEGPHQLRVSAPGMLDYEHALTSKAGDSQALRVELRPQPSGIAPLVWVGAGVVAASGLVIGGYFLLRGSPEQTPPYVGSLGPGTLRLPAMRH